ncbi:hypothetical protein [Paractinoplanes globisporus]|uniref:Uncharacterized protein n=1 Tax=Paractinoplanes globisporus TaxID=113565 RepID=A0ABW6WT13_9ACTN|nr:hypothetical protein [Actinoplanes globisporus]
MNRVLARGVGAAVIVTFGVGISAGTSDEGNSKVDAALQSPFAPVVIAVLKRQAAKIKGPAGIALLLGTYELDQLRKDSLKKANSTFLVVRQQLGGRPKSTIFRFDSGHRVRVAMNGKFDELIDKNVVTITPDPAVDSTIVVTDATTGDTVERTGSFKVNLSAAKAYTGIDFDTGTQVRVDHGSMDYSYYGASFTNGARMHKWDKGDPTLADCSSIPSAEWSKSDWHLKLGGGVYCIVTSDGRFGYFHLVNGWTATSTYAVWPPLP